MKTRFLAIATLLLAGMSPNVLVSAMRDSQEGLQESGMLYMLEEEKLARDVYQGLARKWGAKPFSNIARAEQQHMDRVQALLNRKGIKVAVSDNPGVFKDTELQTLYDRLVKQGSASFTEALRVGATIEDRDIFDLDRMLKDTKDAEARTVLASLRAGSENHLRAFVGNLTRRGQTYKPQFISQATFDSVVGTR